MIYGVSGHCASKGSLIKFLSTVGRSWEEGLFSELASLPSMTKLSTKYHTRIHKVLLDPHYTGKPHCAMR